MSSGAVKKLTFVICVCLQATPYTAESVATACEAPKSLKTFLKAINNIKDTNRNTDLLFWYSPPYHCDNERLTDAQKLITDGLSAVKYANRERNFDSATSSLGRLLHTLQVFCVWKHVQVQFPKVQQNLCWGTLWNLLKRQDGSDS